MTFFTKTIIETAAEVKSLAWDGNRLIDWAGGGSNWGLDGTAGKSVYLIGYPFDSIVTSPDGRFFVLYQLLGTKGRTVTTTRRRCRAEAGRLLSVTTGGESQW